MNAPLLIPSIHLNIEVVFILVSLVLVFWLTRATQKLKNLKDNPKANLDDLIQVKEDRHRSEQRYKTLFEHLSDCVFELDMDGLIVSMNDAAQEKLSKYHDGVKSDIYWVELLGEVNFPLGVEYLEKTKKGKTQNYTVTTQVHGQQTMEWHITQIPIYVHDQVNGVFSICQDITPISKMIGQNEAQYKIIADHISDMVRIVDIHGKCSYASPSHLKILGYEPQYYIQHQLFYKMVHPEDVAEAVLHFNDMVTTKQPKCLQFRVLLEDGRILYLEEIGTPVIDPDGGVEHIVFVSRDITEKKQREQELAAIEAKHRIIVENMSDLIAIVSPAGVLVYVSKGLGYDDQWLLNTSCFDYVHPEDMDDVKASFQQVIRTKTNKLVQFRLMHINGDEIDVDCMATPVIGNNGAIESVILVARDITEKVKMIKELQQSEERYRRLIELSPQPILSHRDGRFIYINAAGLRLMAAAYSYEIVGRRIADMVNSDDLEQINYRIGLVMENYSIGSMEYKIRRLDGQWIDVETTGIYDAQTHSVLTVCNDITERKKMEKAIKDSEQRFRKLVELSPVSISEYRDDRFLYVNPAGLRVMGIDSLQDVIGTELLNWVHPDDKPIAKKLMDHARLHSNSSSCEYRIVCPNGRIADLFVTAIYDAQSQNIHLVFKDITERKQTERALRESEELNRKLVELSPETIFLHSDNKFDYVNPAGLAMFGVPSMDDMIGKPVLDRIHPTCLEEAERRLSTIYDLHLSTPSVEQRLLRYDGSTFDSDLIAVPIFHNGKNSSLTLIRDISDRKSVEEERKIAGEMIRQSEERYSRLQTSVDRIFHDLFGVMKVSEMERRLIKEIKDVIKVDDVSLIHIDLDNNIIIKNDSVALPDSCQEKLLTIREIPVCKLMDTVEGHLLKIAEIQGKSYVLWIGEKSDSLTIAPNRVWLQTIVQFVSVLFDNFRLIEDLTNELEQTAANLIAPSWLLRLLFNLSENERKRLSQDLHDGALQEQIIWYRKIDELSTNDSVSEDMRQRLSQISQGLLDVIYQIRLTCNELRPPMLKEEGLVSSLEALFDFTQLRVDYSIQFDTSAFSEALNDDVVLGMYRIVQELLSNATKHSKASDVHFLLKSSPGFIQLIYSDNGVGMNLSVVDHVSFQSMGITGMRERVRSLEGTMDFDSSTDSGLKIRVMIPSIVS